MLRTPCLLLLIGLATSTLIGASQAQQAAPEGGVRLYLNRHADALGLTSLAPSARNATTWSTQGRYFPDQGLSIKIPLSDPNPNWLVDETAGVEGWVDWSFTQKPMGTVDVWGHRSGVFAWKVVEGERSTTLTQTCTVPNQTYHYSCDQYRYLGTFPGHEGAGSPHTHGDGTDAKRGLLSGDVQWVLTYTIPPCKSLDCLPYGSSMAWTFSVRLDGSTFLRYHVVGEQAPKAAAPAHGPAVSNQTGNQTAGAGGSTANGTSPGQSGNTSGNGSAGGAFRPRAYDARRAQATAPGAPVGAMIAAVAGAAMVARRRRA
jgi:hypothetical protein